MSTGQLMPAPFFLGFDNSMVGMPGGLVNFYQSGTSTRLNAYSDSGLTTPLANPAACDAAGRLTAYLSPTSYKIVLTTPTGTVLSTVDPVQATNAAQTSGLGEIFVFGGDPTTVISAAAYPSGATFDKCHAGTAFYNVDSANLTAGTYILEAMGLVNAAATLTVAIMNLDDGSPDTPLASLTITSTTGARAVSGSITFAAAGVAKNYGIKVKISANSGEAWAIRLVRSA